MAKVIFFCFISQLNTAKPLKTITTSFHTSFLAPQPSRRLTGELQSEALLAGEEVCGELHADSVEGAVGVLGHRWATQLSQKDATVLRSIPDAKHIVDLLRVENQEVQTVKDTPELH